MAIKWHVCVCATQPFTHSIWDKYLTAVFQQMTEVIIRRHRWQPVYYCLKMTSNSANIKKTVKSFRSHMGPWGGTNLHFFSPQPDTRLCYQYIRGYCILLLTPHSLAFTVMVLTVSIYSLDGWSGWLAELTLVANYMQRWSTKWSEQHTWPINDYACTCSRLHRTNFVYSP